MGIDILIDRVFPLELLKTVFLKLLDFPKEADSIVVAREVPNSKLPEECSLLIVVSEVKGQMSLLLELYFQQGYDADLDMLQLTRNLCVELGCNSLISDDSVNPYTRIKVDASGGLHNVMLEVAALDDNDEYIIISDV